MVTFRACLMGAFALGASSMIKNNEVSHALALKVKPSPTATYYQKLTPSRYRALSRLEIIKIDADRDYHQKKGDDET